MPAARGFLERFRTGGTPGAAAGAGVPADRVAERDAELAAVFERLEDVEAACATQRAEALDQAEARRVAAAAQARRVLAAARDEAETDRREAAAAIAAQADEESAAVVTAAQAQAAAVREHADGVLDDYVERALLEVRRALALGAGGP
jgi:hypothetical protein